MAWYSFLTGADVQKNIDYVADGLDAMVFTDEEKSVVQKQIVDAKLRAIEKASVARRIIAIAITVESILLVNATVALHLIGWVTEAQFVKALLIEFMLQPFLAVVGFYFLTQLMSKRK